jgi:hypothetical protein
MSEVLDVDKITNDDLIRLAKEENEAPVVEQDEDEVTLYKREIDLGDGSGIQVFTDESLEGLVDKLATAQVNATRKIREQATRLKALETPVVQTAPNDDDEFILGQELVTRPTKTIEKLVEQQIARREEAMKQKDERETAIAQDFIARNPDYLANQANGAKLFKYLQTYKLTPTVDTLEQAYTELNQSGLLEAKSAEVGDEQRVAENTNTATDNARIGHSEERARVAEPVQRKKVASGLSSRGSVAGSTVRTTGPSEDELYDMPLDKLRDLANKAR